MVEAMMRETGFPMPSSFPSASEVKLQARELSSEVYSLWHTLNFIVIRREDVIRKRWMKKNKNTRANILLRAWPNMPTRHRPDFWALSHPESSQQTERYANSFRYPYINLEDLTKPRPLLLLLNARARNNPSAFAHADVHKWRIGGLKGVVRPLFLNEHTMYLAGQQTSESYGKLISWDEDDNAFHLMHNGLQFQPGEGILALEAEKTILDFLIKCCEGIFADLTFTELTSLEIPTLPVPPALISQDASYSRLSLLAAEAPYRAPLPQDFQAIKTLIVARRAAAEDHIWDLREDPAYLAWVAATFAEHMAQRIPDTSGKLHPNADDDVFWQKMLTGVVLDAYRMFLIWDQLYNRTSVLLDSMPTDELDPQTHLPSKLCDAFLDLRDSLDQFVKYTAGELETWCASSPTLRSAFVRKPNAYGTTDMFVSAKSAQKKGSLINLMSLLWDEEQRFLYGLTNVVDEIQRLMDNSKEDRAKFSDVMTATFSDLALMSQTVHYVENFFPWSASFDELAVDFKSWKYARDFKDFELIMSRQPTMPSLVASVMPFSRKLSYPINKTVNESNTNTMRESEANLDRYWKIVDEHFGENGKALHNMLLRHGAEIRQVKRTPPYSHRVEDRQHVGKDNQESPETDKDVLPSRVNLLALNDRPQRLIVEPPKRKPKTRGLPVTDSQARDTATPDTKQPTQPEPVFQVSKRAVKVFKSLFYTPSATRSQVASGDIAWAEFLHAMASAGCSIDKLHGSVWQFTPRDKDSFGWHAIHFHEPHPSNKIPFTMARRIGRRLSRNYGWSEKSFVAVGQESTCTALVE